MGYPLGAATYIIRIWLNMIKNSVNQHSKGQIQEYLPMDIISVPHLQPSHEIPNGWLPFLSLPCTLPFIVDSHVLLEEAVDEGLDGAERGLWELGRCLLGAGGWHF